MLSYQHIFHAGNHADILKHYVLAFVIESLNKKDKPYTFFDTHSASGVYDLLDNRSRKTGEAEKGILTLLQNDDFPCELESYKNLVQKFTVNNLYPGSPLIELNLLRKTDTLILSELHPQEIQNLKKNISINKKPDSPCIQIHNRNGWEMLNALTPPKTKRGAVLIDPSYEEKQDYTDAAKTILSVNKKWNNGIILLWYPLLSHRENEIKTMIESIDKGCKEHNYSVEILNLQLFVNKKDSHKEVDLKTIEVNKIEQIKNPPRLYGSGMLIINAPWKLKEQSKVVIQYLESKFYEA